jgi:hypothetical protein
MTLAKQATEISKSDTPATVRFVKLDCLINPAFPFAQTLPSRTPKVELKALVPEDAREASGHGLRAKRSKSGSISFEVLELEASHAALQR